MAKDKSKQEKKCADCGPKPDSNLTKYVIKTKYKKVKIESLFYVAAHKRAYKKTKMMWIGCCTPHANAVCTASGQMALFGDDEVVLIAE